MSSQEIIDLPLTVKTSIPPLLQQVHCMVLAVLSVRFEVGVSLLLAPAGAYKRGLEAPFPLVENAGIQPAIPKRVPAGAPAGARSY